MSLQKFVDVSAAKQPRPPSYSHVSDLSGGAHFPELSRRDAKLLCGLFEG
jgi:hypothetical protein